MSIPVSAGKTYTFGFSPNGSTGNSWFYNVVDYVGDQQIASKISSILQAGGFPITGVSSQATSSEASVSFTYQGAPTDMDALGQAMADAINSDGGAGTVQYTSGIVTSSNPIAPVSPSSMSTTEKVIIAVVAVLLLAVGIYGFAGGAGEGFAERA